MGRAFVDLSRCVIPGWSFKDLDHALGELRDRVSCFREPKYQNENCVCRKCGSIMQTPSLIVADAPRLMKPLKPMKLISAWIISLNLPKKNSLAKCFCHAHCPGPGWLWGERSYTFSGSHGLSHKSYSKDIHSLPGHEVFSGW